MAAKRILQSIMVVVILTGSFASIGSVAASPSCASYVTVQPNDTLDSIAAACGTTVEAIQAANPGLSGPLNTGQVLYIPAQTGSGTYVIQPGDTLGNIAINNGVSISDLLAANPQLWNAISILPGQVINLPVTVSPSPSTYDPTICNPSPYNPSACIPLTDNPSSNIPSTYDPTACNPSPYNPSACDPSNNIPSSDNSANNFISIVVAPPYSVLKVTSGHGLIVRTGAGTSFGEIHSPLVAALNHTRWWYRKNSVTVDSTGMVWVEIQLNQMVNGYSFGWIMVKDMLGNYFTSPNIDP